MSLQRLDQIHAPDVYDDTLTATEIRESEINAQTYADHNNALLSQLKRILRGDAAGNWFDDPALIGPSQSPDASLTGLSLRARLEDKNALTFRLSLEDLAVPPGQNWVVFTAAGNLPAGNIAIANDKQGVVVSQLSTLVGVHSLDENAGLNPLQPKNLVQVFDASTGAILRSGGRDVYGLLQVGINATDGNPFAVAGLDQGQISFVRPNSTFDDLEAVPLVDIATKSIVYRYTIREDLQETPEEAFRGDLAKGSYSQPGSQSFEADCPATVELGDWVYVTGPTIGGRYQVAQADVTTLDKMPALGVVTAKPTATSCRVQWEGEAAGFSGLTPRRVYYLQQDGSIDLVPPSGAGHYVQRLGTALDASVLLVSFNSALIRRAAG